MENRDASRGSSRGETIVRIEDLRVDFAGKGRTIHAVRGVTLEVAGREALGLVGESGSGKSTTGRAIVGLQRATSGRVLYRGTSVNDLSRQERGRFRREIQMIFQDPSGSLNPTIRIGEAVAEPLDIMRTGTRDERREKAAGLLRDVGLDSVSPRRYPHELSGGQRQRVCIARALALDPQLLICDEAVSALDVLVQAQILNLLMRLREERGLAFIFISHDLAVVRCLCERVAVMRRGEIVEEGRTAEVFDAPRHDYTRTLVDAVPRLEVGPGA